MQKGQELMTAHCPLLLVYELWLIVSLLTTRKHWVYWGGYKSSWIQWDTL